jgi:prepilin-type processing-associated H-X9-DG protein
MLKCMPQPPYRTLHDWVGTSYRYNFTPWNNAYATGAKDPDFGCAGKKDFWITQPARRILFDEIPAEPYSSNVSWYYFFWHEARRPSTVRGLWNIQDRLVSPVLFADGHALRIDFTRAITSGRIYYPCEPQPDWYFYEPLYWR